MKMQDNIIYGPPRAPVPNISLGQMLFNKLRSNNDRIVQVNVETGDEYSNKYVLEKSIILANFMKNYGIHIEDRITLASENHMNYIIAMCSTLFIGATFAPLNPAYTEREFRHMLQIFEPRIMFVSRRTEQLLAKIAPTLSWSMKLIQLDDEAFDVNTLTLKEILEKGDNMADIRSFVPTPIDKPEDRVTTILCSSGTTGLPKGVMLSHRGVLIFNQNCSQADYFDVQKGARIIVFLPMFHGYAFVLIDLAIYTGSTAYIMRNFNLELLLQSIAKYKITHLPVVPPVLVALSKHPNVTQYDFSSVKELLCGASPLPKDAAIEAKKLMKIKNIRNAYGMTEMSFVSTFSDRESTDDSVGRLLPGFKAKVIDPETGKTLGPGKIGELCFAGDQLMLGYLKNPKTTAETIDKDNWIHTGDLGYFSEDGLLYVTGRLKELIKYKGFQVSPTEIETIILAHPGVKDVAVMGKPDELAGELPMALVVKQPNSNVTAQEIINFANGNLSPQKRLRGGVKFIEAVPRTASGKIMRQQLASMVSKL